MVVLTHVRHSLDIRAAAVRGSVLCSWVVPVPLLHCLLRSLSILVATRCVVPSWDIPDVTYCLLLRLCGTPTAAAHRALCFLDIRVVLRRCIPRFWSIPVVVTRVRVPWGFPLLVSCVSCLVDAPHLAGWLFRSVGFPVVLIEFSRSLASVADVHDSEPSSMVSPGEADYTVPSW